jgi:8-oxo-dGTP pyrophosphatase MutT (NUDIX family)
MNNLRNNSSNTQIGFKLDYSRHISVIDSGLSKSKLVKRFRQIMRNTVRLMNTLPPYTEKLYYREYNDHIMLYLKTYPYGTQPKPITEFHLLIQVGTTSEGEYYFAPWIYEFYQRTSRIIIHKNPSIVITPNAEYFDSKNPYGVLGQLDENNEKMYLVHRSFPNRELQHPGGHLEYIEVMNFPDYDYPSRYTTNYSSGISYVKHVLSFLILDKEIDTDMYVDNAMRSWFTYGGIREVHEESGLDLTNYFNQITLTKIGTKTFYLSVSIDTHIIEEGPDSKYASEIIDYQNVTSSKTSSKLDDFWLTRVDPITNHAWLTGLEMVEFWETSYKEHIMDILNKIDPK